MTSDFPSREELSVPLFAALFTITQLGPRTLKMPGNFLHLTTDGSEAALESGGNTVQEMTKCVVMLDAGSRLLIERNTLYHLRWVGHVLRMPPFRLHFRALFPHAGQGWRKRRSGQATTWRCMNLASVSGLNWRFPLPWLGSKRWGVLMVWEADGCMSEPQSVSQMLHNLPVELAPLQKRESKQKMECVRWRYKKQLITPISRSSLYLRIFCTT